MDKEYILCAAIWFDDKLKYVHQPKNIETGFVVCGHRHHNCFTVFTAIKEMRGTTNNDIRKAHYEFVKQQGFITNTDRFVDRAEAGKIAFEAGQIKKPTDCLFSEDLY